MKPVSFTALEAQAIAQLNLLHLLNPDTSVVMPHVSHLFKWKPEALKLDMYASGLPPGKKTFH